MPGIPLPDVSIQRRPLQRVHAHRVMPPTAEKGERELRPDGRIGHADLHIGDSVVMLSEASGAYPARPCGLFAYTDDVDATCRAALAAGATSIREPTDQPWGDRVGGFHDPFDNRWWVATHLREVS